MTQWFQQTYADKYKNEKVPFTDKRYRQQLMDVSGAKKQ